MSEESLPLTKRQRLNLCDIRLYPPKTHKNLKRPRPFQVDVGEEVIIVDTQKKSFSAVVTKRREQGRLQVASKDKGLSVDLKQHRVYPKISTVGKPTTIVLIPETLYFRQMVYQVDTKDRVLEIGCSTGETSKLLLARNIEKWMGWDTSNEMLETCRDALKPMSSQCEWIQVDALAEPERAVQEAKTFTPTVVLIDIGGNRDSRDVVDLTYWAVRRIQPKLIIVKSREWYHHALENNKVDDKGLLMDVQRHEVKSRNPVLPKHPLKAPLVLSPRDNSTPICRYYNYHKQGCRNDNCVLDHTHCHACRNSGHTALHCPKFQSAFHQDA